MGVWVCACACNLPVICRKEVCLVVSKRRGIGVADTSSSVSKRWDVRDWVADLPSSLCPCRQPWTGFYDTCNYVQYQRLRAGEPDRTNSLEPNMCLVVATGTVINNLTLGLGTVHPNCRVSHYGFANNDASVGWSDGNWTAYNESNPLCADEAINLNYLFDVLDAGASVTFTWAYILNMGDLLTAMNVLSVVSIVQPTTMASGTAAAFSAVVAAPATLVVFTISNATMVRGRSGSLAGGVRGLWCDQGRPQRQRYRQSQR